MTFPSSGDDIQHKPTVSIKVITFQKRRAFCDFDPVCCRMDADITPALPFQNSWAPNSTWAPWITSFADEARSNLRASNSTRRASNSTCPSSGAVPLRAHSAKFTSTRPERLTRCSRSLPPRTPSHRSSSHRFCPSVATSARSNTTLAPSAAHLG